MRHRLENGGITVRALRDRCEWGMRLSHMYCTLKAGHSGPHFLAYPGTQGVAAFGFTGNPAIPPPWVDESWIAAHSQGECQ